MDSPANLHHHNRAQKVGQMRVSTKSNRRKSITSQSTKTSEEEHDEADDEKEAQQTKKNNNAGPAAVDPILVRDLKDRYARDLQAHTPSRHPSVSANPGSNVKQIRQSDPQHRGLSH